MPENLYMKRKHPEEQKAIKEAVALNNAVLHCSTRPELDSDSVLVIADKFKSWLLGDIATAAKNTTNNTIEPPTPTLAQKKVIDKIVEKTLKNEKTVCLKLLEFAKAYGQNSYPTSLNIVDTFLEWANGYSTYF